MKFILLFVICVSSALALPSKFDIAQPCTPEKCKRENGCVCASSESPLDKTKTPQLVTITIDDSLRDDIYDDYVAPLLLNRKNPDGKPITATFYVPHQYTSYEKINQLYNLGFDIGVNSISKDSADYWKDATVEQLTEEFDGQRKIVAKYANITIGDVQGARTPHFQLAGNRTFKAYTAAGLTYDNSYPVLSIDPLFPFTLEYELNHPCQIGECPTESFKNFWVLPIINFLGPNNNECNVLVSCGRNGSASTIRDWLYTQFNNHYNDSRTPINLLVTSSWFGSEPNSFEGLKLFLDDLGKKNDVFLVSHSEVIRWAKNPVEASQYITNHVTRNRQCKVKTCNLPFGEHEIRHMRCCADSCPAAYPWVGNPDGKKP